MARKAKHLARRAKRSSSRAWKLLSSNLKEVSTTHVSGRKMVETTQSTARTDSRKPPKSRTAGWAARWAVAALLALAVAPAWALPGDGTYMVTGSTTTPRIGAAPTLLQNGKVLIAGEGSAELYDPATGTWSATGNPTAVRRYATATLLQNGKVLVAGAPPRQPRQRAGDDGVVRPRDGDVDAVGHPDIAAVRCHGDTSRQWQDPDRRRGFR